MHSAWFHRGRVFPHSRERHISCKWLPSLAFPIHKDESGHEKDMQEWDSGIMMCKLGFHERAELFGDQLFLNRILPALCNVWRSHCWKVSPQLFLTTWQLRLGLRFSHHFTETLPLWPECISHLKPDQRKAHPIMIALLLMVSVELSVSGSTI